MHKYFGIENLTLDIKSQAKNLVSCLVELVKLDF